MTCTHDWRSLGECPHCVAEERDCLQDDLTRLRTHHLAETSRLTREVLELRAGSERLRAAAEWFLATFPQGTQGALVSTAALKFREALAATPAPVVPASGSDCPANKDPGGRLNKSAADMLRAASAPAAPKEPPP